MTSEPPRAPGRRDRPRALVVGGSLAGLFAALLLRRAGWKVTICERAASSLATRGAGIVTHPELVEALALCDADPGDSLGVAVSGRLVLDREGGVICRDERRQVLTSWGRIFGLLAARFPPEDYRLGMPLVGLRQDAGGVTAAFADGSAVRADLLVGADGIHSTVRRLLEPETGPGYAGYVAWRGLVEEEALSSATRAQLGHCVGFSLPRGEQMLGYPVLRPETEQGGRLRRWYNFVWYRPAAPGAALERLFTDAAGRRYEGAIPPDRIAPAVVAAMRSDAARLLAPQFGEVVARTEAPFLQAISDLASERIAFGRVALVGDAAFVARPHVGMGVTKAAGDAVTLAACLAGRPDDLAAALGDYDARRGRLGREVVAHGRALGAYMQAQVLSEAERRAAERYRSPEAVIRETAVFQPRWQGPPYRPARALPDGAAGPSEG